MKQAAIIDVGSHSIRYAVGRVQDGQARMEPKRLESTHLAEGVSKTGRLGEVPMMRALWAIEAFARDAAERGVPVYAYATSAVRDSENRADFCQRTAAIGITVRVLEPAEEARLALLGATGGQGGLLDIGGGSTEILRPGFLHSAPLGCVKARELCDSAYSLEEMKRRVFAKCKELFRFPPEKSEDYVGVGGTITTVAALMLGLKAYDGAKVAAMPICHTALDELVEWLYDLGSAGRAAQPLLKGREHTILPGALILVYLMKHMGLGELRVSDRDGMEGFLLDVLG